MICQQANSITCQPIKVSYIVASTKLSLYFCIRHICT